MRFFCLIFFFISLLNASELIQLNSVSLKKDETKEILIKYEAKEKILKFWWTLYKNESLVFLWIYDEIPHQNILLKNHKNQSLRVDIRPDGREAFKAPYIIIKFDRFDFKKNKATFRLFLYDKTNCIKINYIKKEE